jgi:hypothetical protein
MTPARDEIIFGCDWIRLPDPFEQLIGHQKLTAQLAEPRKSTRSRNLRTGH